MKLHKAHDILYLDFILLEKSSEVCNHDFLGFYSADGTECTRCPSTYTTRRTGATSINYCTGKGTWPEQIVFCF